jgi:glycosyltransferase involved in cell wall biosynthesis
LSEAVAITKALGLEATDLGYFHGPAVDKHQVLANPAAYAQFVKSLGVAVPTFYHLFGETLYDRNLADPSSLQANRRDFAKVVEFCRAAGVPVVAGRSGGAPETVRDGETGRVVNGRAHEEIVDAITDLLSDPDRARLMGQAGRDWISRDWNWQTHSGRLAALLRVAPPR